MGKSKKKKTKKKRRIKEKRSGRKLKDAFPPISASFSFSFLPFSFVQCLFWCFLQKNFLPFLSYHTAEGGRKGGSEVCVGGVVPRHGLKEIGSGELRKRCRFPAFSGMVSEQRKKV